MDYLAEIKAFHRKHVRPYSDRPQGCWGFEIRRFEKALGFELPLAYKQYLRWMGKDYNGVFVGSDWFLSNVVENTQLVAELLAENQISFELPEHYLCFFSHQGYMAAWFELPKASENPPAWFYQEGMEMKEPVIYGTFTDFLYKDMQCMAGALFNIFGGGQQKERGI
jgi:hypothetical protein